LDARLCWVESDVESNGLGGQLPFPKVTTFTAADVEDKKGPLRFGLLGLFAPAELFHRSFLLWAKLLDEDGFDPIVETA
jgi:hypothetical protein